MGRGPLLGANDNTDKSIGNFLLTMSSSSHPCRSCVIQEKEEVGGHGGGVLVGL